MASNPKQHFTPEEYLELERQADFKSEYLDGQIYAMAGASPAHSAITFNLYGEVNPQLRSTSCRGFSNDTKVRSSYSGLYSYPDLSVVCGEPIFLDDKGEVLLNPKVIFEILSPSTEAFDRGAKFLRYQILESFTDYVLIAQDEPRVEHFIRQEDGSWRYVVVKGLENTLHIAAINCTIALAGLYNKIKFPEEAQA
ncbi:MAG: Uma2 family endonuclease [Acidobacteria bacterium]|nr:Uma2 family endonuclease [Acidobacteriota bacterium]